MICDFNKKITKSLHMILCFFIVYVLLFTNVIIHYSTTIRVSSYSRSVLRKENTHAGFRKRRGVDRK